MKGWTIARQKTEYYGHSNYGIEFNIWAFGGYDIGPAVTPVFPPIFLDKAKADEWLEKHIEPNFKKVVVEVEIG